MTTERAPSITLPLSVPPATGSGRHVSPPPPHHLRQRPLGRAATLGDAGLPLNRRRSSIFSEGFSEIRKSLRTSTDDLLLPRVSGDTRHVTQQEASHWHSIPLGLALLPAVGGLLFNNGSAIFTDITLLVLAAIFLNWSVRLPWDWYLAAQARRSPDSMTFTSGKVIEEEIIDGLYVHHAEEDEEEEAISSSQEMSPPPPKSEPGLGRPAQSNPIGSNLAAAKMELHIHEVLALLSCFLGPIIGAWLLHAIRSQLSRPSEGLVSNYNLSVFLLASEIRPLSHLVKMVQARTLFLQRVVNAEILDDDTKLDNTKLLDLLGRLEELEAHVADSAEHAAENAAGTSELVAAKASAQAASDLRKGIQPELDALNRAVRRYEKRTTISAIQTEARLQDLETRLKDVVVLAAAVQRNAESQPRNFIVTLTNWACGAIVLPMEYVMLILALPSKGIRTVSDLFAGVLGMKKPKSTKETKQPRHGGAIRSRERKGKTTF